jgi:hypothetical protein
MTHHLLLGADAPRNAVRNKALIAATVFTAMVSMLSAGSAKADSTDCSLVQTTDILIAGDKAITGITCLGDAAGNANVKIDFGQSGALLYEFSQNNVEAGTGPSSSGSISYNIKITDPDFFFQRVRLTSAGTDYVATKTVRDAGNNLLFTLGENEAESFVSPVTGPSFKDFTATQFFQELNILDFWSSGSATDATVQDLNNIYTQKTAQDPSEVPGPLPILGAAAAFGLSRRLRVRIKQSAPTA